MAFEFDGEKYKQAAAHQREWGTRLIAELGLKGNERILDLGCGEGGLTAQLAELVPQGCVLGIDASEGMIAAARQRSQPNLKFELLNINDLDFHEEFEVVFSNATLHWVKDHRWLLGNVHNALTHGGVARFNFGGDGNCAHFIRVIREAMSLDSYAPYFRGFDWPWYMPAVDKYRSLVQGFPFTEATVWGENADRYFPDAEAMICWIDQPSLVPFLHCVAEVDKPSFREWVVQRMIEETQQEDGRCFETFRRINLLARK
jgi:trans-aconitate methyltransferase